MTTLIDQNSVFLDADLTSKDQALKLLAEGIKASGSVSDVDLFLQDVKAREEHSSTGIGFGVAIPHGKSDGVIKPALAFARPKTPLDWDAIDGKPVSIIILLAVPKAAGGTDHLRILATISKQLIHESFRQSLLDAKTNEEIIKILDIEI